MKVEKTGQHYNIEGKDKYNRKIYFSGLRQGRATYTLDYTHARHYSELITAERMLQRIQEG